MISNPPSGSLGRLLRVDSLVAISLASIRRSHLGTQSVGFEPLDAIEIYDSDSNYYADGSDTRQCLPIGFGPPQEASRLPQEGSRLLRTFLGTGALGGLVQRTP